MIVGIFPLTTCNRQFPDIHSLADQARRNFPDVYISVDQFDHDRHDFYLNNWTIIVNQAFIKSAFMQITTSLISHVNSNPQ